MAACRAPAPTLSPGDPDRPDIFLVSVDTLRADHLGCYGHDRPTSPFLDGLAAGGVRFANAWSPAPWTLPAHATLLSGVLPVRHGAVESDLVLTDDLPRLPRALGAAGYATGGFTSSLFVSSRYGFDAGFNHFDDFGIHDKAQNLRGEVDAEQVTAAATAWAATVPAGQPVFAFLHLYDVHYPYAAPGEYGRRFDAETEPLRYRRYAWYLDHPLSEAELARVKAAYDEEIAYVDATLAAMDAAWRAAGREVLWVVVADHGEELGERGAWGHGHTLWPEQLHVPWIAAGPGVVPAVAEERVGLEDVAATVAGYAGVPWEHGTDRSSRLRGGEAGPDGAPWAGTSRFKTRRVRWHADGTDHHLDLQTRRRAACDLGADPTCATPTGDGPGPWEADLWALYGDAWEATEPVVVRAHGGVLVREGRLAGATAELRPGDRLGVAPVDATVRWEGGEARLSGGGPLRATRSWPVRPEGLTEDEAAALEALGYVTP